MKVVNYEDREQLDELEAGSSVLLQGVVTAQVGVQGERRYWVIAGSPDALAYLPGSVFPVTILHAWDSEERGDWSELMDASIQAALAAKLGD